MHDSIECYRGHLPQRVEEKSKLNIIVPLDFEWQGLETTGIEDAEGNRHDATPQNVEIFLETARRHLPPPRPFAAEPAYEQVASQPVSNVLSRDRPPGSKHERLLLSFRNQGTIPLQPEHATIEWKFDTEKALAEKSHIVGPKVVESGATIGLRRIGERRASCNGAEIQFFLDESMASMLTETISRSADIVCMEVKVRISSLLVISEIENVREVVTAVAQSVLDSWD